MTWGLLGLLYKTKASRFGDIFFLNNQPFFTFIYKNNILRVNDKK